MLRTALAIVATLLLVGVLALLIVESRAVDAEYYTFHTERTRAIETTRDDLNTIATGVDEAFKEGRTVPFTVNTALGRIVDANEILRNSGERTAPDSELRSQVALYGASTDRFIAAARGFTARQNELAESLRLLQEESPEAVKDLRRFNLRIQSQNVFSLAIDIIEFASGRSRADTDLLLQRIDKLRTDPEIDAQAPGLIDGVLDAANRVIAGRGAAESALNTLNRTSVSNELWALSDAIAAENRETVGQAERARLLLSMCAILLVVGVVFVVFRLQQSYRALNQSNAELEQLNSSLEERVNSRTEELSSAYNELQESQVQLVQAEKMSSLGELVAGISHEINTPLWYLTSNATIVQERLESLAQFTMIAESMITAAKSGESVRENITQGLKDMQRMFAEGLKDDLEEATDLVQDSIDGLGDLTELAQGLKDFSRLDRAHQGEFDVHEGLDKTLLIAKNKLKSKVSVHKHYGEVPKIHCSPSQINQIFLNLLTNAADAIEENGEILVRTWSEDDKVHISIADTGCGIEEDVLPKIWNPFFTTKEVGKGTGLGLSIVNRIVNSHGGELQVESAVGKGTNITVVLPVKALENAATAELAAAQDEHAHAADTPASDVQNDAVGDGATDDEARELATA